MFRKMLGLGLVIALLLGLIPAAQAQEGPVVLRYANFTAGEDRAEELDQIIAAFEAENPNIQIEPYNMPFATTSPCSRPTSPGASRRMCSS
jgi:ABC-type glycerol-3-phosphate transport system substrate-binding protein